MKILYTIAGFYRTAGMERVLALKVGHFAARGEEVVIVTTEQKGRPEAFPLPAGARLVDLGIGYEDNNGGSLLSKVFGLPLRRIRHRKALREILRAEKPDVAVSMFCGDEGFLPEILRRVSPEAKSVLECHFSRFKRLQYGRGGLWSLADRLRSASEPRKALKFDRFVVLTREDCGQWLADCPALAPKIAVIPNPRTFEPGDFDASLRGKTVFAAGRYGYQKNFGALIDAWAAVPAAVRNGWTLCITGDGEERTALENKAAERGLQITFGPAEDMISEYSRASVFALTSRYEGLPMVLLEAQAAGLPIVSFDCKCGPKDVITDGVDGFLVQEGDTETFAARLSQLMTAAGLRESMGRSALQSSARFAPSAVMSLWDGIFNADAGVRTVVVSAVGLRKGGTLRILQQTLEHLSGRIVVGEALHVIALVHDRALCDFPSIEYIEIPWATKTWLHRLWCEYVTMHRISIDLKRRLGAPVDLWFSLHDTTPRVVAKKQEVYCHTSFPFLRLRLRDFVMDPKIPAFRLLTPLYYKAGARRNDSIIVQQEWFADALSRLMRVPRDRFRVIPPSGQMPSRRACATFFNPDSPEDLAEKMRLSGAQTFLYVSTPDCHKNFETLLEAARLLLERSVDIRVTVTLKGGENRYARWLYRKWGNLPNVDFHGFLSAEELERYYGESDCLVFPSRVETWGLPISEYEAAHPDGMLLLADLPYAHGH